MRLLVGAPVANRAWALPRWFECLATQTRRPDGFVFLHSGQVEDDTYRLIRELSDDYRFDVLVRYDPRPPHSRHDNERFRTLADLRNKVLQMALTDQADLFLSLDTDIMLENPETIERLRSMLSAGADIASVATAFHPLASDPNAEVDGECWAYNAGWLDHDMPDRTFKRPAPDQIPWGETLTIEIPMGVWLARRQVIQSCRYGWHQCGEDIAFAQDLNQHGFKCWWDTSVRAKHIWQRSHLQIPA